MKKKVSEGYGFNHARKALIFYRTCRLCGQPKRFFTFGTDIDFSTVISTRRYEKGVTFAYFSLDFSP